MSISRMVMAVGKVEEINIENNKMQMCNIYIYEPDRHKPICIFI